MRAALSLVCLDYLWMFKLLQSTWSFSSCLMNQRINLLKMGFPGGAGGKEASCQCRRHKRCGFSPCVGKIPWRKKWQPTPVFLPGDSQGWGSMGLQSTGSQRVGCTEATAHTTHRKVSDWCSTWCSAFTYSCASDFLCVSWNLRRISRLTLDLGSSD